MAVYGVLAWLCALVSVPAPVSSAQPAHGVGAILLGAERDLVRAAGEAPRPSDPAQPRGDVSAQPVTETPDPLVAANALVRAWLGFLGTKGLLLLGLCMVALHCLVRLLAHS